MVTKKKAVVTGGAGFIGSHLVDKLIELDYDVLIIDSMITGHKENINPKAALVRISINDQLWKYEHFYEADVFFHFAAYPIKLDHLFDYETYINETEKSVCNAFQFVIENKIKKFVLPASTTMYGSSPVVPTKEDYYGPDNSFYGTAKFNSERWAEVYANTFDIDLTICRFGRVLGPRSRNGAIWDLCHKLKQNPNKLEVLGNGNQTRSFVHVSDCINGVLAALANSKGRVDIFNIATEGSATVKELVNILIKESGYFDVEVNYQDSETGWIGDNATVVPDITKLKSFGWKPQYSNYQTIRDCVRWTFQNL